MSQVPTSDSLWPVPVRFSDIDRKDQKLDLSADERTCARIAKFLGLASLARLDGRIELASWLDGAVMRGQWSADAEQVCGITLEPLPVALSGRFEIRLLPEGSPNAPVSDPEVLEDPEAPDPPDLIEGETIDVGHYLIEQFALALDPFPRKEGAVFEPPAEEKITPFAALAALKARKPD